MASENFHSNISHNERQDAIKWNFLWQLLKASVWLRHTKLFGPIRSRVFSNWTNRVGELSYEQTFLLMLLASSWIHSDGTSRSCAAICMWMLTGVWSDSSLSNSGHLIAWFPVREWRHSVASHVILCQDTSSLLSAAQH